MQLTGWEYRVQPLPDLHSIVWIWQSSGHTGMQGGLIAVEPPKFRENTGFCLLCQQWKLLLIDTHQIGGARAIKRSTYCIKCTNDLNAAAAEMRKAVDSVAFPSNESPGHVTRLTAHEQRIHQELARLHAEQAGEL